MPIRRMRPRDESEVRSLLRRFKGYAEADPEPFLADPRTVLLVAHEADEVVGWLYGYELIRPEGRRAMLLYELEVAAEAQGRGHGRALVDGLLAEARRRGHLEVWVLTDTDNEVAQALYAAAGGVPASQLMFGWDLT